MDDKQLPIYIHTVNKVKLTPRTYAYTHCVTYTNTLTYMCTYTLDIKHRAKYIVLLNVLQVLASFAKYKYKIQASC